MGRLPVGGGVPSQARPAGSISVPLRPACTQAPHQPNASSSSVCPRLAISGAPAWRGARFNMKRPAPIAAPQPSEMATGGDRCPSRNPGTGTSRDSAACLPSETATIRQRFPSRASEMASSVEGAPFLRPVTATRGHGNPTRRPVTPFSGVGSTCPRLTLVCFAGPRPAARSRRITEPFPTILRR